MNVAMLNLQQGTDEWKAWRQQGIGGSDAAAILNKCPYKTVRALFLEKTGKPMVTEDDPNKEFIFNKGHEMEELIRQEFFSRTKIEMHPTCFELLQYPYLKASLDGYNKDVGVLEAKLVGKKVIEEAINNKKIPNHHYIQIQHQLMVCGADTAFWFAHDGKKQGALVTIERNGEFLKELEEKEHKFWNDILNNKIPPLSDRDYLVPDDQKILQELKEAKIAEQKASEKFEELKTHAINLYGHAKIAGDGIKIYKSIRTGSINYLAVPEVKAALENLGAEYLENFRKKDTESWTVRI